MSYVKLEGCNNTGDLRRAVEQHTFSIAAETKDQHLLDLFLVQPATQQLFVNLTWFVYALAVYGVRKIVSGERPLWLKH